MRNIRPFFLILFLFLAGCGSAVIKPGEGSLQGDRPAQYTVSAWFPDYDRSRAITSFRAGLHVITEINPVWFILDGDGNIVSLPQADDPEILQAARNAGILVVPTVMNCGVSGFDPVPVMQIATDPSRRKAHARALADLVAERSYDGIEIDYEGLPASIAPAFTSLAAEIRSALPRGKLFSLDVYAKTSPSDDWAERWEELLPLADRFKIMVYDEHWSGGEPGPIASLSWTRQVLDYALRAVSSANVPPSRVIVGMPFYGWDWPGGPPAREAVYSDVCALEASGLIYIRSKLRDPDSGEVELRYIRNGIEHIVYYQDQRTVSGRLSLLAQSYPQLGGVAFWRLGGEDPLVWTEVQKYLK